MVVFDDAIIARMAEEERTSMSEFLGESRYHTKWSAYYRTYFVLVAKLYPETITYGYISVFDFKSKYRIDNMVNEILNREEEFSFDIGDVYAFPDLIGVKDGDPLFHHEYKEGIYMFLSEVKEKLDSERSFRAEQKRKHEQEVRDLEALRQKHSKVVVL